MGKNFSLLGLKGQEREQLLKGASQIAKGEVTGEQIRSKIEECGLGHAAAQQGGGWGNN